MVSALTKYKLSVPLEVLGYHKDRFCEYGERLPLDELARKASMVKSLDGVGMVYFPETDVNEISRVLKKYSLGFAFFTVDLSRQRRWHGGSLTSRDEKVRREAIEHIKNCIDATKKLDGDTVNVCPMGDGYDYHFETNYSEAWRLLIAGLKEVCDYDRKIKITIEYKRREPRAYIYISDVGRALYLCQKVDRDNIGVTVDFGHAFISSENPAEAVCLAAEEGRLFGVHINDNYGDWDWDMIPASMHFLQTLEGIIWAIKEGYQGWIFLDIFPMRYEPVQTLSIGVQNVKLLIDLIQKVGPDELLEAMKERDYLKGLGMLFKAT
jgi:xylose isomerase